MVVFLFRCHYICNKFYTYAMDVKGVITGDIVDSSKINLELRSGLIISIKDIAENLIRLSPLKMELFRGDSFQLIVDKPEMCLKIAILLRAGLKSMTPVVSDVLWDARVSVGIGEIAYTSDKIVVSDGEAFRFSGRGLDEIGKRRLVIKTKWEGIDDEFRISTPFVDDIVTGWTVAQAKTVFQALLYGQSQKDIALCLGKTAQSVSKLLGTAKEELVESYLERYSLLVTENLRK